MCPASVVVAVALGSINVSPTVNVIVLLPFKVMVGATVVGDDVAVVVAGVMMTTRVVDALTLSLFVTKYKSVVVLMMDVSIYDPVPSFPPVRTIALEISVDPF
jgi:hypothetical protein